MSPIITYALLIFMGLYGINIFVELLTSRNFKKFILEAVILLLVFIVLSLTTGFPDNKQAFGGVSPLIAMSIMFICILLGICANYFFYMTGKFTWRSFLKPFFISPIVLLPLIGSVQGASNIESIQMISFGILSFQNGFFWRVILEQSKTQI